MHSNQFLLYGANGYTGRLILSHAAQYGLQPVIAGRNAGAISRLAGQFSMPYRVVDLDDKDLLHRTLKEVPLVLHVAGPFSKTAKPMIEACIRAKAHYLDITGEIAVFEMARRYDAMAREAGIMVMPGVGFDVVPTDCLALFLKQQLPDAARLRLAFTSVGGGLSHGTAATMIEGLGEGGLVRQQGKITRKPLGHKGMRVDFGMKKVFVMTIPWGDVATAYHTTGIPDIETYTGVAPIVWRILKWQFLFNPLLRTERVRNFLRRRISRRPPGPDRSKRLNSKSLVWGDVLNTAGKRVAARLETPDGYTLTALTSLLITGKVLQGDFRPGYQTPAGAYGADLILDIPGTSRTMAT